MLADDRLNPPPARTELPPYAAAQHTAPPELSTFLSIGVPFFWQGNFGWGEKLVKKTLAMLVLMGLPAVTLARQASQNTPPQETAPSTTGSSTAKSHHSKHRKHSKNAHHKSQKRHTSKQHTQAQ